MYFKQIKIGNVVIKNNVFLAPLAGITDVAFRHLAKAYGAGLAYTEMISAKALTYNNQKTVDLCVTDELEQPCAVQIFGSESAIMREAVTHDALAKFDIIDINMGCPVQKIVGNGEGSALMKDVKKASEIIKSCVQATTKPVTVKFRKGYDDNSINAVEFAKMCEDSGASCITVHGRTRMQLYGGKSDMDIIAKVKQAVNIPVIANGDIVDKASAINALEITGADGVMIARGALGNPAVFSQILDTQGEIDLKGLILYHINKMAQYFDERYTVVNMRKHIGWYLKGVRGGKQIKDIVNKAVTVQEVVQSLDNL